MSMSADGSKWLCYTSTNYDSMVWAAVQLTPNSFLMADNNDVSSGRRYAGVPEQAIFWITTGSQSDYTTAWAPTAEEVQFLTAESQTLSAQLGNIPDGFYCQSGSQQSGLPGIKELLEGRGEPAPGKFALVQRTSRLWREVLLCVQMASQIIGCV
jgi:hypothetical protein